MTSIMEVDQAAAVILTTVAEARALDISPSRWVYVHGAGEAHDLWWVKDRVDLPLVTRDGRGDTAGPRAGRHRSGGAFRSSTCTAAFPSPPARGALPRGSDRRQPRLVGDGWSPYFGGAGNNHALHAIATMARALAGDPAIARPGVRARLVSHQARDRRLRCGAPSDRGCGTASPSANVPSMPCPIRRSSPNTTGRGTIETYTVLHDRDGAMTLALVVVRGDDGRRTLATIEERDVLATLERDEMVGAPGISPPERGRAERVSPSGGLKRPEVQPEGVSLPWRSSTCRSAAIVLASRIVPRRIICNASESGTVVRHR